MKHFGSHPNEECRNEFSAYSSDVMFGQWFLTLAHQGRYVGLGRLMLGTSIQTVHH